MTTKKTFPVAPARASRLRRFPGASLGVIAMALLSACSVEPRSARGGDNGGPTPEPVPAFRADLRMRALTDGTHIKAALFEVQDVEASVNGVPLRTYPGQRNIDLANTAQAWLLGSVDVPVGAEKIDVAVRLDDFGGYEADGEAGTIDARHATLRFEAPVKWLAERDMATLVLDLDRSLVTAGAEHRVLVPQAQLKF